MNLYPPVLQETVEAGRRERVFTVPPTLGCFAGHFPGFPLVPAFVQIGWVMDLARAMRPGADTLTGINALKFLAPIRPGDTVHVSAKWAPDGAALSFRVWNVERVFSSGRCLFDPPAEAGR